jgi:hypothetical protein
MPVAADVSGQKLILLFRLPLNFAKSRAANLLWRRLQPVAVVLCTDGPPQAEEAAEKMETLSFRGAFFAEESLFFLDL